MKGKKNICEMISVQPWLQFVILACSCLDWWSAPWTNQKVKGPVNTNNVVVGVRSWTPLTVAFHSFVFRFFTAAQPERPSPAVLTFAGNSRRIWMTRWKNEMLAEVQMSWIRLEARCVSDRHQNSYLLPLTLKNILPLLLESWVCLG